MRSVLVSASYSTAKILEDGTMVIGTKAILYSSSASPSASLPPAASSAALSNSSFNSSTTSSHARSTLNPPSAADCPGVNTAHWSSPTRLTTMPGPGQTARSGVMSIKRGKGGRWVTAVLPAVLLDVLLYYAAYSNRHPRHQHYRICPNVLPSSGSAAKPP